MAHRHTDDRGHYTFRLTRNVSYLENVTTTVAVHGRLNVNVALNRPTFAISEWYHSTYGTSSSWKAVDGNKDTYANKIDNSCFKSQPDEDNPWWAVDLGAAIAVVGVLFTNRGDNHGNVLVFTLSQTALPRVLDFSSTTRVVNYSNSLF